MEKNENKIIKNKFSNNKWLESEEFLSKVVFHDKYYFDMLAKHISNYLKLIPIPVLSTWDSKNKRIYFSIGKEKKFFEVDVSISYRDYITLLNRWLKKYFPTYEIEYEAEEELTEDEILKMRENDSSLKLNDLLFLKKKVIKKEKGIITKIQMTNDEFHLVVNDIEYIRISGTIENPMSLSVFLKMLREIQDNNEKKNFIFSNSEETKMLGQDGKEIDIEYEGKQMLNFFIIQYPDLKNIHIIHNPDGSYTWGKYKIIFQSSISHQDCIKYLKDRLRKEGIEYKI